MVGTVQKDRSSRTTTIMVPVLVGLACLIGVPIAHSKRGGNPESWTIPPNAQVMNPASWAAFDTPLPQSQNDGETLFIPPGHTAESLKSSPFHIYDPSFLSILGPNPTLTLLAESPSDPLYHEAAVWHPGTDSVFFVQNAGAPAAGTGLNKSAIVERISLSEADALVEKEKRGERGADEWIRVETIPANPAVINPNGGILWDDNGVIFAGEGMGEKIPSALYLMNPRPPYNTTVLVNNFFGRQFNSLNDVAVLRGWIYFTDVDYGAVQDFRAPVNIRRQVYRFHPSSGVVEPVTDHALRPNGLCFSPDGRWLYVTDTGAALGFAGKDWSLPSSIYRFPVRKDGRVGPGELFAYAHVGVPDGVHTDAQGNVYSGVGDGVHVWNPQGTLLGKIYVGETSANFQFTREGIIILAETHLWYAKIAAKGDCIPGLKAAGAC